MRPMIIPTKVSTKVAAALDIMATLAVEHVGYTYKLPFWHPAVLGVVAGMTYALFKWKDEITSGLMHSMYGLHHNTMSYFSHLTDAFSEQVQNVPGALSKRMEAFDQLNEGLNITMLRNRTLRNKNRSWNPN